jgi:FAD/FMN-containing dehydrogenase
MTLKDDLQKIIKGDILDDPETLEKFSKDASIFVVKPKLIIAPLNPQDIESLVNFVNENPKEHLNITPRAAGTCMSGGPLGNSIVLDMTKYFNQILQVTEASATTQPGVFYRDFEKETLKKNLLLPCYTSSREMNTVGGMVGNNSAGEKSLSFGQTEKYVKKLKAILSDGKEYSFAPLTKEELDKKIAQKDFEGKLYKEVFDLVTQNQEIITNAPPKTSKNSTGLMLWKVWDGKTFDMTKVLVGSQGTLGVITEIEFDLIQPKKYSYTVVITLKDLDHLIEVIHGSLKHNPESFECFDNQTLMAATKYYSELIKDFKNSKGFLAFLKLLPELFLKFTHAYPPLTLLAEFTGDDEKEVKKQCQELQNTLEKYKLKSKVLTTKGAEKYWIIRRQSFALLKNHAQNKLASPFIDDIIVDPDKLSEFLPKLDSILKEYDDKWTYTLAGHIGNGNFHIIPLMNLSDKDIRELIPEISERVFNLVFEYKGSMAAEHNDGLVRGPFLEKMYGEDIYQLFKKVKDIFDPQDIFNPNKKSDATFEYSLNHLKKSNV